MIARAGQFRHQRPAERCEPEALRLLRLIVLGTPEQQAQARRAALPVLRYAEMRAAGRPCRVSRETLREIARLAATGKTQQAIADALGVTRDTVCHHLKPSAAMQIAMMDAEGAT